MKKPGLTRILAALLGLGLLASCGANGAPFVPSASVGVSAGSGGVRTDCSLGTSNGTITLIVGC